VVNEIVLNLDAELLKEPGDFEMRRPQLWPELLNEPRDGETFTYRRLELQKESQA